MYDVVIVGAGAAGCVLANRLTADSRRSVLLLEAGEFDKRREIRVPLGWSFLWGSDVDWGEKTTPQAGLNGRVVDQPRGKVIGGSAAINAMIIASGHPEDYDGWALAGNDGWSHADLQPYFRRAVDQLEPDLPPFRLPVEERFLQAAGRLGLPREETISYGCPEGFGRYLMTIRKGRRFSPVDAYLQPALYRPNLTVRTGAHVLNLLFQEQRVVGVRYYQDEEVREVKAAREVILCAGAFHSPQILLLSGIGPAAELRRLGIHVRADRPGVGQNLHDHLLVQVYGEVHGESILEADRVGRYRLPYLLRRGPLTSNGVPAGGFWRSQETLPAPDIQFFFHPGLHEKLGHKGIGISPALLNPQSRGSVRLRSTDALHAPLINPNYLSEDVDLLALRAGVKLARRLFQEPPLREVMGRELAPGAEITSDEALDDFIRTAAETVYHPVGTCPMGPAGEAWSVVEASLSVVGVEGLRVVDAAAMPTVPRGNTQLPVMALAEKAAEMVIRG